MVRILVIDDDAGIRRMLHMALASMGYTVSEAADGREGLALFDKQPADLVISDLVMPGKEGIETIRTLRKAHPHLKIIAMSGGSLTQSSDNLKMAKNLGANAAFSKPFSMADLSKMIESLLGTKPSDHTVSAIKTE
jgi:CheY-like chemotaxis protein